MKEIPISAAKKIAKDYGYDQVIIFARKVGEKPDPHGEYLTTYGVDETHCGVAARVGNFLKEKIMGWCEPKRYFFDQDESSHWYQIPVEWREEWDKLSEDENAWELDEWQKFEDCRLGGGIQGITFDQPSN